MIGVGRGHVLNSHHKSMAETTKYVVMGGVKVMHKVKDTIY